MKHEDAKTKYCYRTIDPGCEFLDYCIADDCMRWPECRAWWEKDEAINIIIDETDSRNPIFVEIEDDEGQSIGIGKRSEINGLTRIRITSQDIDK